MGLSDHELIYCSRKLSLLKLNEHYEISFRSMKNDSDEIFADKPYLCEPVTKFLSAVDSVSPIRTLRVKSNTKLWFDIDVLNAIRNRDKHYKKFQQSGMEIDRENFKYARLSPKKVIYNKKKLYFEEKIAENKNNPKELWRTLKSLGMPSKRGRQSKISLKENGVVSFDPKKNANIFCRLFSNIADSLLLKLPRPKNKFGIKTTRDYYKEIRNKSEDFVLHNVDITSVEKILKNLYVAMPRPPE